MPRNNRNDCESTKPVYLWSIGCLQVEPSAGIRVEKLYGGVLVGLSVILNMNDWTTHKIIRMARRDDFVRSERCDPI